MEMQLKSYVQNLPNLVYQMVEESGVKLDCITMPKIEPCSHEFVTWAKRFYVEKQCFSNVYNLVSVDPDYVAVTGFIYDLDTQEFSQHAWHKEWVNDDVVMDRDLTKDLFFSGGNYIYFAAITLTPDEAHEAVRCAGGIHLEALKKMNRYKKYFNE